MAGIFGIQTVLEVFRFHWRIDEPFSSMAQLVERLRETKHPAPDSKQPRPWLARPLRWF